MAPSPITLATPAKINLYLGVHEGRDPSGYHKVDSLTACVDVFDQVTIRESTTLRVSCNPAVGIPEESNTCWIAAKTAEEVFGRTANVAIHVEKNIPDQAGLGASSSDAAAVIYGLCTMWGEDPAGEGAHKVAREVGADVALFLVGAPAFLAGRGDELVETFPMPSESHIALIKPTQAGVNTTGAYAEFDRLPETPGNVEGVRAALRSGDLLSAASEITNNLELVAKRLVPGLSGILMWAGSLPGVARAMVTGSGTSIFCICEDEASAANAVYAAKARGLWAQTAHITDHGPRLVVGS